MKKDKPEATLLPIFRILIDIRKKQLMTNNDLQWIKKAKKGNQAAIKQLYDCYEVYWFRICLRYGRNRVEAQDIFQESVIHVFKVLNKFDEKRGLFKSWSSKVVVNVALKYLKKNQWEQSFDDLSIVKNQVDETENALGKITAKELIAIIQQLPTGYRVVFNMHEIEGFSHKEIAKILNISIGTSKSQLSKAKKKLQEKLKVLF